MIRQNMMQASQEIVEEGLSFQDGWACIVQDLIQEGFSDEEIATLLRPQEAWIAEARDMKAAGIPDEDIVFHLLSLKATWTDVVQAFLGLGLSLGDMLRVVLPVVESEACWHV